MKLRACGSMLICIVWLFCSHAEALMWKLPTDSRLLFRSSFDARKEVSSPNPEYENSQMERANTIPHSDVADSSDLNNNIAIDPSKPYDAQSEKSDSISQEVDIEEQTKATLEDLFNQKHVIHTSLRGRLFPPFIFGFRPIFQRNPLSTLFDNIFGSVSKLMPAPATDWNILNRFHRFLRIPRAPIYNAQLNDHKNGIKVDVTESQKNGVRDININVISYYKNGTRKVETIHTLFPSLKAQSPMPKEDVKIDMNNRNKIVKDPDSEQDINLEIYKQKTEHPILQSEINNNDIDPASNPKSKDKKEDIRNVHMKNTESNENVGSWSSLFDIFKSGHTQSEQNDGMNDWSELAEWLERDEDDDGDDDEDDDEDDDIFGDYFYDGNADVDINTNNNNNGGSPEIHDNNIKKEVTSEQTSNLNALIDKAEAMPYRTYPNDIINKHTSDEIPKQNDIKISNTDKPNIQSYIPSPDDVTLVPNPINAAPKVNNIGISDSDKPYTRPFIVFRDDMKLVPTPVIDKPTVSNENTRPYMAWPKTFYGKQVPSNQVPQENNLKRSKYDQPNIRPYIAFRDDMKLAPAPIINKPTTHDETARPHLTWPKVSYGKQWSSNEAPKENFIKGSDTDKPNTRPYITFGNDMKLVPESKKPVAKPISNVVEKELFPRHIVKRQTNPKAGYEEHSFGNDMMMPPYTPQNIEINKNPDISEGVEDSVTSNDGDDASNTGNKEPYIVFGNDEMFPPPDLMPSDLKQPISNTIVKRQLQGTDIDNAEVKDKEDNMLPIEGVDENKGGDTAIKEETVDDNNLVADETRPKEDIQGPPISKEDLDTPLEADENVNQDTDNAGPDTGNTETDSKDAGDVGNAPEKETGEQNNIEHSVTGTEGAEQDIEREGTDKGDTEGGTENGDTGGGDKNDIENAGTDVGGTEHDAKEEGTEIGETGAIKAGEDDKKLQSPTEAMEEYGGMLHFTIITVMLIMVLIIFTVLLYKGIRARCFRDDSPYTSPYNGHDETTSLTKDYNRKVNNDGPYP